MSTQLKSQPVVIARRVKGEGFGVIERNSTEVLMKGLEQAEAARLAERVTEQLTEGLSLHDAVDAVLEAERIVAEAVANTKAVEEAEGATDQDLFVGVCRCGCGAEPSEEGSRFLPGHDGRLKGRLLKIWRGVDTIASDEAAAEMRELGWGHFLVETKAQGRRAALREDLLSQLTAEGGLFEGAETADNAVLLRQLNHVRALARKAADKQARMIARREKEAAKATS